MIGNNGFKVDGPNPRILLEKDGLLKSVGKNAGEPGLTERVQTEIMSSSDGPVAGTVPDGAPASRELTVDQRDDVAQAREQVADLREATSDRRDDAAQAREQVAELREVTADQRDNVAQEREQVAELREEVADQRDEAAQLRDQALSLRENTAASRELLVQESERIQRALESHITRLRNANESLVIATLNTQSMADEVRKAKDQMGHMAHHDFLTGLPNRNLLEERLAQAIALAKRHRTKLAVLFMDLDRFKTINDSLGHAVGDALLQSVAQRLQNAVRGSDTVSRQGGDEFVALLSEVADENAVALFADKICKAVSAGYVLADQELHVGATIGISMYPEDGADAETLIRHADVAMYHAKKNGGNNYSFFTSEMTLRAVERQRLEADLYRALERQQFELHYQPQVELQTGRILGAEALIRWRHPERGLLLPNVFIPVAEECDAIVPIGRWVLREACRQTQAWLDASLAVPAIAVNISAVEFMNPGFMENVRAILFDTGLAPHYLELELTESVLMKDAEATMSVLQELKSMGVKIAIDDFGTGYSSLSYLQQFPVDTLKIDQSFVADIVTNGAGDGILIDSVIGLGRSLGHHVVAEGIETPAQLKFLIDHLCLEGQGNYLGEPLSADGFAALLKAGIGYKPLV